MSESTTYITKDFQPNTEQYVVQVLEQFWIFPKFAFFTVNWNEMKEKKLM